jgi:hypothetical protein
MRNPAFNGQPVILIHLLAKEGDRKAWCTDTDYEPTEDTYRKDIPRVLCPACAKAGMQR